MIDYTNRARIYQNSIRQILIKEWDPIGIESINEAQDEYDAYVGVLYKMIISRRSKSEIFDFLWSVETDHMGLVGNRAVTESVSERLIELADSIDSNCY